MRRWSRTSRQGATTTSSSRACAPATRTRSASCSTATTHHCAAWPARYVATDAAADEVVQDTWLGVLRGIDRFEQRSSLKTWIFRILMNIARTGARATSAACRSRASDPRTTTTPTIAADRFQGPDGRYPGHWAAFPTRWHDHPEVRALGHETLAVVRDALDMLPPAQQEVVRLRDLEGWTSFEVCNALGLTETNQRVLLHRGRGQAARRARAVLRRGQERMSEPSTTSPTCDCIELVELVTEYLDAALADADRARFEHHVGRLPGLRGDPRAVPRRHRHDRRAAPGRRRGGATRRSASSCSALFRDWQVDARADARAVASPAWRPARSRPAEAAALVARRRHARHPARAGPAERVPARARRPRRLHRPHRVRRAARRPLRGVHAARRAVPVGLLRTGRALPRRQRRPRRVHPGRLPPLLPHRRAALAACRRRRSRRRPTPTATSRSRCTRARPSTRSTAPAPTPTGCSWWRRTRSSRARTDRTLHPHRVHVDEIDVIVESDRDPFLLPDADADRRPTARSPSTSARSSPTARRSRPASAGSRRRSSGCSPTATAATTASTRRCSRPGSCSSTSPARSPTAARASSTACR